MKILGTSLILLVLTTFSFAQTVAVVKVTRANLREGPDLKSKVVKTLENSDWVNLLRKDHFEGWYYVEHEDDKGWLHESTVLIGTKYLPGQRTATPASTTTAQTAEMKPIYFEECPNYLADKNDSGIDIAYATKNVNFRASPSGDEMFVADKGDIFALVHRSNVEGWFNLIHIVSGKEGYVYGSNLRRYCTQKVPDSIFVEKRVASNAMPTIEIENDTDRTLTLRLGEEKYQILAGFSRSFTLNPGNYRVYASVPRAYPNIEDKSFQRGIKYSIRYFISTRSRD